MIEPLPTPLALIDQVHDRLVAAISDGTLAPGHRITQEDVAARLGVSRQPVSHALQILRRRGLLEEHGKRGLVVAPLDAGRLRQLYQVRAALEALAASLAARRVRAGAVSRELREQALAFVTRAAARVSGASVGELIADDVAFHSMLHRMSGNDAIVETVAQQWPHFMRSMGAVLSDASERPHVWNEHQAIVAAVLAGDAESAEVAARRHIERATEEIARRLEAIASVA